MKVVMSGSMQFASDMLELKDRLEALGHTALLPKGIERFIHGEIVVEKKQAKLEGDVFNYYYNELKRADALLVLNKTKSGVQNYIGGNALIEMAFAYVLKKKIYLINPIPDMSYSDEIAAMNPSVLHNDLSHM